jgi:cell division protein FtsL
LKILKLESLNAFLARLSKREKIIFYCTACFILTMSLDRLIISPVYSRIHALNKEIKEKESDIKRDLHIATKKDKILSESERFNSFFEAAKTEEEERSRTSRIKLLSIWSI